MTTEANGSARKPAFAKAAEDGTVVAQSRTAQQRRISFVPVENPASCVRNPGAATSSQGRQLPTGREQRMPRQAPAGREQRLLRLLADGETSTAKILLLGMNDRTASIEVRERFAVSDPAEQLHELAKCDEIDEAMLLSTCNRVEIVVTTHHPEAATRRLQHFLQHDLGPGALPQGVSLQDCTYLYQDGEAVAHVFRVASSIDSMVVGEPQILGQVKDAYGVASEAGFCGPLLARLYQRAFATAKRVKNETRIGERPVSVPRVAVRLANKIFEELSDKTALLIGAGEMIELALESLRREGLAAVRIANRTCSNAAALANRFDATAHGYEELDDLLMEADVVLSCIGGDVPLLGSERVAQALRARQARPLFFIDIGVPRNVDPEVNRLDNAYLYDLDDLRDIATTNAEERRREGAKAEQIVLEEQQGFDGWLTALQAVPTIRDLQSRGEEIRVNAVERAASRLGLDDMPAEQREALDALTRSIVNKLLHGPMARLRGETGQEEGLAMLKAARALFELDDCEADPVAPRAARRGSALR